MVCDLTQNEVREFFDYDSVSGQLHWKKAKYKSVVVGKIAGCATGHRGYVRIVFNGRLYAAHRLVWIYNNGSIPEQMQIDHLNGIRFDNRLENLRCVTETENNQNKHNPYKTNKTGFLGVSLVKKTGKFYACIKVSGKNKNLGHFSTAIEAYAAYVAAKREFHAGYCF